MPMFTLVPINVPKGQASSLLRVQRMLRTPSPSSTATTGKDVLSKSVKIASRKQVASGEEAASAEALELVVASELVVVSQAVVDMAVVALAVALADVEGLEVEPTVVAVVAVATTAVVPQPLLAGSTLPSLSPPPWDQTHSPTPLPLVVTAVRSSMFEM